MWKFSIFRCFHVFRCKCIISICEKCAKKDKRMSIKGNGGVQGAGEQVGGDHHCQKARHAVPGQQQPNPRDAQGGIRQ